jgi:hypothetical protein
MNNNCFIILFRSNILGTHTPDETLKQDFKEAITLIEKKQFKVTLPIWFKLQKGQPTYSNKLRLCYISSLSDKKKSLPHFNTVIQDITKNYNPHYFTEKKAPVSVFFNLVKTHHYNYELGNAITFYQTLNTNTLNKTFLYQKANYSLAQCKNSNMETTINSPDKDYSSLITIDTSSISFTSRKMQKGHAKINCIDLKNKKHFEDIYVSHNYKNKLSRQPLLSINIENC